MENFPAQIKEDQSYLTKNRIKEIYSKLIEEGVIVFFFVFLTVLIDFFGKKKSHSTGRMNQCKILFSFYFSDQRLTKRTSNQKNDQFILFSNSLISRLTEISSYASIDDFLLSKPDIPTVFFLIGLPCQDKIHLAQSVSNRLHFHYVESVILFQIFSLPFFFSFSFCINIKKSKVLNYCCQMAKIGLLKKKCNIILTKLMKK